jgi:hypothetical protein
VRAWEELCERSVYRAFSVRRWATVGVLIMTVIPDFVPYSIRASSREVFEGMLNVMELSNGSLVKARAGLRKRGAADYVPCCDNNRHALRSKKLECSRLRL